MVKPESAAAYRGVANPVTVELNWPSAYGKLRGATDYFKCELNTYNCSPAQKTQIAKARQSVGSISRLRAVGTIALYVAAFDVGWSIGRTIDTKWLRLSGEMPLENATWDVMHWTFTDAFITDGWYLYLQSTTGPYSTRAEIPWPQSASLSPSSSDACTGSGNSTWSGPLNCGSQWAYWRAYQLQTVVALASAPHAGLVDIKVERGNSAYTCGSGSATKCLAILSPEMAMENAVGAHGRMFDSAPVGTQGTVATNVPAPSATPIAFTAPTAVSARAALLEDEPAAQSAAGTSAETSTGAHDAGQSVDPSWEGYPAPTASFPDCRGLTVAACNSLLQQGGWSGTVTELELDIATADLTRPAGAVVTTTPAPGANVELSTPIELERNPDPMPLLLPEPFLAETYAQYISRLQGSGYVGTSTFTELTEGSADSSLGPDAPVTVTVPAITGQSARTMRVGQPWPGPAPRIRPDTAISFTINPPGLPPLPTPTPGTPASGPGLPPAIDFTPITGLDFGCKFPYGFVCYALDVTEWFNVSPDAPVFSFDLPDVSALGTTYVTDGQYVVDLNVMDDYMALLRGLMSVALWIGTVYILATRLLGFRSAGDPGEAVDEGLDWR
jgi:hypothetical protein